MYNFELFNDTKIVFGNEWRSKIGKVVSNYGKKVLLVTGGSSIKKSGLYDELCLLLKSENIEIIELSGILTNPTVDDVNKGVLLCRDNKIDVLLAVGGGSVIDCAKSIAVASFYEGDFWDLVQNKIIIKDALPIITIPTISGTGTEMNNSCVITNPKLTIKRGFNNDLLRPKVSFLVPELTYSVSPFHTACGVADALSHILDTVYMVKGSTMSMLQGVMEAISRTLIEFGPKAVSNGEDYEARANIMWASSWGLNGFLRSGVKQLAACHAIEHELSARFNVAHGFGMAVIMPCYYEYVLNSENAILYESFAKNVFGLDKSLSREEASRKMLDCLCDFLFEKLKLPSKLNITGVSDGEIEEMANKICWGKDLPGLVTLSVEDVAAIIKKIM